MPTKHPLISNFAFDTTRVPKEFADWKARTNAPNCLSTWQTASPSGRQSVASLMWPVLKAIRAFVEDARITVVKTADDCYAAEKIEADGRAVVCLYSTIGRARGCIVNGDTVSAWPVWDSKTGPKNVDPSPLYACILAYMADNNINMAGNSISLLKDKFSRTKEYKSLQEFVYGLCDDIYRGIQMDKLPVPSMPGGNLEMLPKKLLQSGALEGTTMCGPTPKYIGSTWQSAGSSKTEYTIGSLKKVFSEFVSRNCNSWTDEEKSMIPTFADNTIVSPDVVRIARVYTGSQQLDTPIVNMMWRGETGIGKSTGVRMLACILNMPLVIMSCNSGTETESFLSSFVPVEQEESTRIMPQVNDLLANPVGVYHYLTGSMKANATPDDCVAALTKVRNAGRSSAKFALVESPYITALKNGYIVEVQECSRIKDAGVLPGLNAYDLPGARIPLANGSWAYRHPRAFAVYTDNIGYAGCRSIDQSVIRRMGAIIDSKLSEKEIMKRIKARYTLDNDLLKGLYGTWNGVRNYCENHEIHSGSTSVVELENWINILLLLGVTPQDKKVPQTLGTWTFESCVVSKATNEPEEQREIFTAANSQLSKILYGG